MTNSPNFANKRWVVKPRINQEQDEALHEYDPILRQLLVNRGYKSTEEARHYLEARPPLNSDPFQMLGMGKAVERILYAITNNEKMAVYGDYDVDGVTATALLTIAIQAMGGDIKPYIPNRFEEGYGLNKSALEELKDGGMALVITVDNGIRSLPEVAYARQIGLDLIITDHHQPKDEMPDAIAVIDPKQPFDPYPDKNLSGVGLAYKLVEALSTKRAGVVLESYLDLVALGTVADVVPLTGENRYLVRRGLEHLRTPNRQGVLSLMGVAGLIEERSMRPKRISTMHIGYMLAPRINAAGRLESALDALNLLMTDDFMEAGRLAQQLNLQNKQRQELTKTIQVQAEEIALQDNPHAFLLFAAHPDFNPGIVGLAASRLVDTHYRPAAVGFQGDEVTRASCRSIDEFHITRALDECADLLVRHGGHAAAAGFTVRNENLTELIQRLQAIAERELKGIIDELRPTLHADMEIQLSTIRPKELLTSMALLEPTGESNPEAVFVSRNVQVKSSRCVGNDQRHMKLYLTDKNITYDAIAFGLGNLQSILPKTVDILYTLGINEYNGTSTIQLEIKDIQPTGII